jgi:hypothetical protein
VEDLWDVERYFTYFTKKSGSEFFYDEGLDVFRFLEDRRFAFCREFDDWQQVQPGGAGRGERGGEVDHTPHRAGRDRRAQAHPAKAGGAAQG